MKLIRFLAMSLIAFSLAPAASAQTPPATSSPPAAEGKPDAGSSSRPVAESSWKEGDRCVREIINRERTRAEIKQDLSPGVHPDGPQIQPSTNFLPAGQSVELGINVPFKEPVHYFGYIGRVDDASRWLLPPGAITAKAAPKESGLVKRGALIEGETLLILRVPESIGGLWQNETLYLWTCEYPGHPKSISQLTLPVSSWASCSILVSVLLILAYAGAALAASVGWKTAWYRYLDPVRMTAGADRTGSLAKLQILFFSIIVGGLMAYIVARTGLLSDLSPNILLLLGIAAVGSTAAKGADTAVNRLQPDNAAWLIQRGWLKTGLATTNEPTWHDIISTDGEFDVYRYQNCVFSVIVGGALLAGGINELASFEIPTTLLGLLGLSQAVYVGGKLVTKTSLSELNTAVTELRKAEKDYLDAAALARQAVNQAANPAVGGAAPAAGPDETKRRAGEEYTSKASRVAILFEQATGFKPLTPQLTIVA